MNRTTCLSAICVTGCLCLPVVQAQSVGTAIAEQQRMDQGLQRSQAKVDQLDDKTRAMLEEYLRLGEESDGLRDYNAQLTRMTGRQEAELAEFEAQLRDVEELRRRLFPLLNEMVDVLDELLARDAPFLLRERQARVQALRELLDEPDAPPSEKFRRIMEAYQIETNFGRDMEARNGSLDLAGESREVQFLRLGRLLLAYQTANKEETGFFNPNTRQWETLPDVYRSSISEGLRIARKQAPPNLLMLPITAPEASQ